MTQLTPEPRPPLPTPRGRPSRPTARRRASVYILVLALATLSTVIGAGAIAVSRLGARTAEDSRDWSEASVLAVSAVEAAIGKINQDATWRLQMISGVDSSPMPLGRGTARYRLVDEVDNNLLSGLLGPVRVYGTGSVGRARRHFSALIAPEGGPPVTALQCAAYSQSNVTASGTTTFQGGPLASALTLTVNLLATVNGSVEAAAVVSLGFINGSTTILAPPRSMPGSGVFDLYAVRGTTIPYGSIGGGTISRALISPNAQPYGATNADGIYTINVPAGATLTIRESRLAATLAVDLGIGARLVVSNSVNWEPPSGTMPILIVRSLGLANVDINVGSTALAESSAGVNFNPSHTPHKGIWNNTATDNFPAELSGLIHVIGATVTTSIGSSTKINGCVLTEGLLNVGGGATIARDPALYANPPEGYTTSYGRMNAIRGTWRWEASLP